MNASKRRTQVGHVAEIHRYPVKSMQGERLERVAVGPNGLDCDRRFAVIDTEFGRVGSAKKRKWAGLLELRAEMRGDVLVVTAIDGTEYRSGRDDLNVVLSGLLGQVVTLRGTPLPSACIEIEWPDVPGLPNAASASIEMLPADGFFDLAPVHLLTSATLRRFRELTPDCGFETRRFRPNVVIETLPEFSGFVERDWVGQTLLIGNVPLRVSALCSRCVMTTLSQTDLHADPQVLRAIVAHNAAIAGAYGIPAGSGEYAVGDPIWLE